jgi:hypothetical protein
MKVLGFPGFSAAGMFRHGLRPAILRFGFPATKEVYRDFG